MEDMNMEINAAAFYGMYGDKGVRVGAGVRSMMALMTEQEQEHEQEQDQEQEHKHDHDHDHDHDHERPPSCEGMMTTMTMSTNMNIPPFPPRSSFSSYSHGHVEGLLSAAAMFHGGRDPPPPGHNHHHSKHLVGGHFQNGQLAMNEQVSVISNSSLSSAKTEAFSNHMEFDRKAAGGGRGMPYWPEPSLAVRTSAQHQEAMVSSLEVESGSCTNPKDSSSTMAMKSNIAGHPHYPRLLAAYLDCQKIGAPPEVVAVLDEISEEKQHGIQSPTMSIGADPELDQFMEAYCEMLRKQQVELAKPYKEGMAFLNKIETQLNSLNIGVVRNCPPVYPYERGRCGSSEEELSCGEIEVNEVDPGAQDKELKDQLLRKYSGYFSTLKKEFLKKRKKGKLPKEARQTLLDWWNLHYKWPYPSEADKVALAESTGLDQKQINNWFINQRKRHWKPSEDMQIMVMDSFNPHTASFFIHETEG